MIRVAVIAMVVGAVTGLVVFRGLGVLLGYVDAHQVGS